MNGEWARIHVTHRFDYLARLRHMFKPGADPRLRFSGRQVEEGIAGGAPTSFGNQPAVKPHLLVGGGVVGPYVVPRPDGRNLALSATSFVTAKPAWRIQMSWATLRRVITTTEILTPVNPAAVLQRAQPKPCRTTRCRGWCR